MLASVMYNNKYANKYMNNIWKAECILKKHNYVNIINGVGCLNKGLQKNKIQDTVTHRNTTK